MGLKFDKIDESRFFFLISGFTTACLKAAGTQPEVRHKFINKRTAGPTALKTSIKSLEGMQSVGQFVGLRCETTSESKARDMGSNLENLTEQVDEMGPGAV